MPSFAVVGAGAIGGYLGTLLAAGGEPVTFIARGANLAAIRDRGMTVTLEDGREVVARHVRACASLAEAGAHDVVLLTVKAHQVADVAPELPRLFHQDTALVTMQNGIPWWYFQRHGGPLDGMPVHAADPDGSITRTVEPTRIIGSIVYPAATLVAPGVVRVVEGRRFTLGELDGSISPRIQMIAQNLTKAGFKAPITKDIRGEIWLKLLGNLSLNPLSALTHATLVDLLQFPLTRDLCAAMMREGEAVAAKLGITLPVSIERRMAGAERVGAHKTSMLQDVEQGKHPEIEALVGAVVELGRATDVPTPRIEAVYACVSLLAKTLADQDAKVVLEPAARGSTPHATNDARAT
ncbi:MAG TPA: 2-dehydropantoate 2-reductase [Gemmatimonadales bacterium]|nr:2-dehydropantoate 2-reductase [Gemmatimonadales bacterium]